MIIEIYQLLIIIKIARLFPSLIQTKEFSLESDPLFLLQLYCTQFDSLLLILLIYTNTNTITKTVLEYSALANSNQSYTHWTISLSTEILYTNTRTSIHSNVLVSTSKISSLMSSLLNLYFCKLFKSKWSDFQQAIRKNLTNNIKNKHAFTNTKHYLC